jgi:hypothetical protein
LQARITHLQADDRHKLIEDFGAPRRKPFRRIRQRRRRLRCIRVHTVRAIGASDDFQMIRGAFSAGHVFSFILTA